MQKIETRCCRCLGSVTVPVLGDGLVRKECPNPRCHTAMLIRVRAGKVVSVRQCGHSVPVLVPISPPGME